MYLEGIKFGYDGWQILGDSDWVIYMCSCIKYQINLFSLASLFKYEKKKEKENKRPTGHGSLT